MSQGKRGEGRVNHDTAPSTKGITRIKERQARPTYWAKNKQNKKMYNEDADSLSAMVLREGPLLNKLRGTVVPCRIFIHSQSLIAH